MKRYHSTSGGYSVLEVLITVSILGILIAVVAVTQARYTDSARDVHLKSQVGALNKAVKGYLNAGGKLESVTTPAEVVAKLKTVSDTDTIPGFRGSFIDSRIVPIQQTPAEGSSNQLRALWNAGGNQFFVAANGAQGIKRFDYDDTLAGTTQSESRESMMHFASVDGWIWDFDSDISASVPNGGTEAPTGEGEDDGSGANSSTAQLAPPQFSVISGQFPLSDFNFDLVLTDPNPGGAAAIYVSVNGGSFQAYENALEIGPDTTVAAFAYSLMPEDYHSSFTRAEQYASVGTVLDPPVFSITSGACCETEFNKSLTLENPNGDLPLTILYSINGGAFVNYEEPIEVTPNTTVSAFCRGDSAGVYDSEVITHSYESEAQTILAAPTIMPDGELFQDTVLIALAAGESAPAGSRIYYTLDGTDPGVDENGDPINGSLYSGPVELQSRHGDSNGLFDIDWDDQAWNEGQGWLDNEWNISQTYADIGGSSVDLSVTLFGGPPAGDIPGPNLSEFSPLGLETHLRSTAGDLADFYYSLTFSEAIRLDDFSTGGLFVYFQEQLSNRIELFDPQGEQISLDTSYVIDSERVRLGMVNGGIETIGTEQMSDPIVDSQRSTTGYDFSGLEVSEIRWWHYAYEAPGPDSYSGTSEAVPGAEDIAVGNDTVTYCGVLYDHPQEGCSTWFYIVESGEQPELSHVTFDLDDDIHTVLGGVNGAGMWSGTFPEVTLHPGQGDPEIGYDMKTAAWGVKFDEGFGAYQAKRYYYTVDENYVRAEIQIHTKAGNAADTGTITGPGLTESVSDCAVSFSLINADTDQVVVGYEALEDGMALDLGNLPPNITIRANMNPTVVGSVGFSLNGDPNTNVENHLPYCINGDNDGDYQGWYPDLGEHTLTATPFAEASAAGTAGMPLMIRFSVINTGETVGHDKSSFLTDINFRVDDSYHIVARVYPPASGAQCRIVSEPTSREITLETSRP